MAFCNDRADLQFRRLISSETSLEDSHRQWMCNRDSMESRNPWNRANSMDFLLLHVFIFHGFEVRYQHF